MKASMPVDRARLEKMIKAVEASGPVSSRSALWVKVAEKYNEGNANPISNTVVRLRFEAWGLTCQTGGSTVRAANPRAFGRGPGAAPKAVGPRKTRGEKFSEHSEYEKWLTTITDKTPKRFRVLVTATAKGSMKAAIKLQCVQCMGHQPKDVKACLGFSCPFYLFRPYQREEPEEGAVTAPTE